MDQPIAWKKTETITNINISISTDYIHYIYSRYKDISVESFFYQVNKETEMNNVRTSINLNVQLQYIKKIIGNYNTWLSEDAAISYHVQSHDQK